MKHKEFILGIWGDWLSAALKCLGELFVSCAFCENKFYKNKQTYKPGSVFDGHLSRPFVAKKLMRHTKNPDGQPYGFLSCSKWGLQGRFLSPKSR